MWGLEPEGGPAERMWASAHLHEAKAATFTDRLRASCTSLQYYAPIATPCDRGAVTLCRRRWDRGYIPIDRQVNDKTGTLLEGTVLISVLSNDIRRKQVAGLYGLFRRPVTRCLLKETARHFQVETTRLPNTLF